MSVLTLPAKRIQFLTDGFGIEPKVYSTASGGKVFADVAVFRSGTFRDSTGVQNTWEDLHLKQMLDNYSYLSNKNIITSVPVRDGHPGWLINNIPGKGAVVGWHQDLKTKALKSPVDAKEYTYLLVDYEITEPYALEKINNGTWRNRSAEIGEYTTNAEAELWPVYMGFAFVDFPAVEGLNFSSLQGKFYAFFGGTSREIRVSESQQGAGVGTGVQLPMLPPMAPPQATPPVQHGVPAPQVQPGPAQPQAPQPFVFSVNGQNTTDPNAVQSHVRQLEQFVRDTREAGRKAFVAGLVTGGKLLAPQQQAQEAFALSLTDEQFAAWKGGWEAAPGNSVIANHTAGAYNATGSAPSQADRELQDAEDMVVMHERAGVMAPDQVKATASYKRLVAAGRRPA